MWKPIGVSRSGYPQGLYTKHSGTIALVVPDYMSDSFVVSDEDGTFEYDISFHERNPINLINKRLRSEGIPQISKSDFLRGFSA